MELPREFLLETVRLMSQAQIEYILIQWLARQENPQEAFDAVLAFANNNVAIKPDILWSCERLAEMFGFKMDN